ncbi:leucyl/phenylalanyl-tRNA--protein transferase [Pseudidiomarina sediminum]|uniref:Leucyl/phenylalanyl-tRNA--protein transferase n=1 Tax=Pseudidiomarina sediminum TaxID=431675 RepID=A0A432Z7L7_9GAMM|nr:leucyl/phenylalanyl-tRNA--protein transferase [Pseudidiomarina sediminum]RUO73886.1 leucyl/phenylalanyl-tRNA--protein transferase [Pseudidiomarina sediminum]
MVIRLQAQDVRFPPPELALKEPNGLLAVGGDLRPERLLNAYRNGIFPWFAEGDPILWWSPDPRAVFTPQSLHESRSMRRFRRQTQLTVTLNHDFAQVIAKCAEVHSHGEGTWITPAMAQAYAELHRLGYAHSIEVWDDTTLVGGMYGIGMGQVFCGESMFHTRTNASKLAFLVFAEHFFAAGGQLLDAQVPNPHLERLGMMTLPRPQFLHFLQRQQQNGGTIPKEFWQSRCLSTNRVAINDENS